MSASEVQTLLRARAPRAPESLRERVLGLEPRPLRAPSRRLVLVVVPAALGVVIAAALVHGFVGSTPRKPVPESAVAHGGAAVPAQKLANPRAFLTPAVGNGARLQHTEASLQLRVARVGDAVTAVTRIVASLGGYAQSVVYSTPNDTAYLELRVPAQNARAAVTQLAALGTLVSQRLSVQDLQHDFEVESAQISQLRLEIAALQSALRNASLPDAQRVLLQIKLADAKRALSQRLHARSGTVASGTTARISLVLSTKAAIVPVPHHHGKLGRMVHSAIGFLGLEGTIVLYALIVLSPLAAAAALAYALVRARRRRDEQRLLAA